MLPNPSTLLSWLFYLIPLYLFVLAPLLRQLLPSIFDTDYNDPNNAAVSSTWGTDDYGIEYDAEGNEIPALNLQDDSFISPEDDVPVECPSREGKYRVHILSREPLVMYIEGFLGDEEAEHLVDVRCVPFPPQLTS